MVKKAVNTERTQLVQTTKTVWDVFCFIRSGAALAAPLQFRSGYALSWEWRRTFLSLRCHMDYPYLTLMELSRKIVLG